MAIYGNLQPPEMLENMKYIDISSENTARICWNDIYRIPQVSLETSKDAGLPTYCKAATAEGLRNMSQRVLFGMDVSIYSLQSSSFWQIPSGNLAEPWQNMAKLPT